MITGFVVGEALLGGDQAFVAADAAVGVREEGEAFFQRQRQLLLVVIERFAGGVEKPLINSTVAANCCVMRCSQCSHIFEYAALAVLLLLALHPPQRVTQGFLNFFGVVSQRFG